MNINHNWTTFQKGRLKLSACSCCGEMRLPSNINQQCQHNNINSSPVIKAGYIQASYLPNSMRQVAFG